MPGSTAAEIKQSDKVSRELKAIDEEIQILNKKNQRRKSKMGEVEENLHGLDKKLIIKSTELTRLSQELAASKKRQNEIENSHKELSQQRLQWRKQLAELLFQMQINGKKMTAETVLYASSLPQYLRNQHYFDYFQHAMSIMISELEARTVRINQLQEALSLERDKLGSLKQRIARQRSSLAADQRDQKSVIASLSAAQIKDQNKVKELARNRAELKKLLDKLRYQSSHSRSSRDTGFGRLKGKLGWPLKGYIKKLALPGVLIAAEEGLNVTSVAAGTVVFTEWMRGFGLLAIIDHGGGFMSLYGHNRELGVKIGDRVEPGTIIATSGHNRNTGKAGLYFEIRQDATPLDPRDWCKPKK